MTLSLGVNGPISASFQEANLWQLNRKTYWKLKFCTSGTFFLRAFCINFSHFTSIVTDQPIWPFVYSKTHETSSTCTCALRFSLFYPPPPLTTTIFKPCLCSTYISISYLSTHGIGTNFFFCSLSQKKTLILNKTFIHRSENMLLFFFPKNGLIIIRYRAKWWVGR